VILLINTDPEHITEPMWMLWTNCPLPARLAGIYANKKGYHNTVIANLKRWPGTYSIRFPLDLVNFNRDKARAIDVTMGPKDMILWTSRMKASAENPADHRLAAVREFYGTLDGKTVFGLIKDTQNGPWRKASADNTHLWHGHMGVFTAFVNDWDKLSPIISVWRGDTINDWIKDNMLPKQGDTNSQEVFYFQHLHNRVRDMVNPPAPALDVDGDYGPKMTAAVFDFFKKRGGNGVYKGDYIAGWVAMQYDSALIEKITRDAIAKLPKPPIEQNLKELVDAWLAANIRTQLSQVAIVGSIKGEITDVHL
jgi:hypothetical protein